MSCHYRTARSHLDSGLLEDCREPGEGDLKLYWQHGCKVKTTSQTAVETVNGHQRWGEGQRHTRILTYNKQTHNTDNMAEN